MTKVKFLVNETGEAPDLYAYFPDYNEAYSHIGQHSMCAPEYAEESRTASPEEYADLLRELVNVGYSDLSIQD